MFSDHARLNKQICLAKNTNLNIDLIVDFFKFIINEEITLLILWESCFGFQIIDKIKEKLEKKEID